jgi:hypothetical protein
LLLEGGARNNAAFLKAELVDEISLVLFPALGGRARSKTFEAGEDGLAERVRLNLDSAEVRAAVLKRNSSAPRNSYASDHRTDDKVTRFRIRGRRRAPQT